MTASKLHKFRSENISVIFSGVWLALCLAVFMAGPFVGDLVAGDEAFMGLNCRYWYDSPIAMLTFWLGAPFEGSVLALRLLSRGYILVCIALPLWYFWSRTRNKAWTMFLGGTLLVWAHCWMHHFYDWDTGAFPFESALLVALACSLRRITLRRAALCGALCALMVHSRIPTAVIGLPCLVWVVGYASRRCGRNAWQFIGITLLWFEAVFLTVAALLKGGLGAYWQSWTADNIITGHGVSDIARVYLPRFLLSLKYTAANGIYDVNLVIFAALTVAAGYLFRSGRMSQGAVCAAVVIYLSVMRIFTNGFLYFSQWCLPAVLLGCIWYHHRLGQKLYGFGKPLLWLILAFAFLPAVGSDWFLLRINFLYSVPFMMIPLLRFRHGFIRWLMIYSAAPMLALGIWQTFSLLNTGEAGGEYMPRHEAVTVKQSEIIYGAKEIGEFLPSLQKEGLKYGFFGDDRLRLDYLFGNRKPLRLNNFSFGDREAAVSFIHDLAAECDIAVVMKWDTDCFTPRQLKEVFSQGGMPYMSETRYNYIFQKEPCRFQINRSN